MTELCSKKRRGNGGRNKSILSVKSNSACKYYKLCYTRHMKNILRHLIIALFLLVAFINMAWGVPMRDFDFIKGVDISYLDEYESTGVTFKKAGAPAALLDILKASKTNLVRLRLWEVDDNNYCSLTRTVKMAKRVKQAGFRFMLDIHYSHTWADPEKQFTPDSWRTVNNVDTCREAAVQYTKKVMTAFKAARCEPDIVQIGNEITAGFMWPYGKITNSNDKDFFTMLAACCAESRAVSPKTYIMLHIDRGSDKQTALWWYNEAKFYNVDYDMIGLSYYSYFHGTDLFTVRDNIMALKMAFNKPVVIVETGYPWTLDPDKTKGLFVGPGRDIIKDFPATPQGQKDYLREICRVTRDAGGSGVVYWEADGVSFIDRKSNLENLSWFDFDNNYLGTAEAYKDF